MLQKIIISILILVLLLSFSTLLSAQTDISSPETGQIDTETGMGCGDGFCVVAWQRKIGSQTSIFARVLDGSGSPTGFQIELTQGLSAQNIRILARGGANNVLVLVTGSSYLKGFLIDSVGNIKNIEVPTNPTSAGRIAATYDPSTNKFLILYSAYSNSITTYDIYGFFVDGNSGSKLTQSVFSLVATTESELVPFVAFDNNKGKFVVVFASGGGGALYKIKAFITEYASGGTTLTQKTGDLLFQTQAEPWGGDIVINNLIVDSDYTFVTDSTDILTYRFHTDQSNSILRDENKSRSFQGMSHRLSFSPMAFDPSSNKYTLAFMRWEGAELKGYTQSIDRITLDNIGPEKLIGVLNSNLLSVPSIVRFEGSVNNNVLAYPISNKIQSKIVDSNGDTPSSKTYSHPTDATTAGYTVIDTASRIITNGFKGTSDTVVLFNHSTYAERLVGTLKFSTDSPDLSTLKIDATQNVTAIDKTSVTGFSDYVLFVPDNNNGAGIRVCPNAKRASEVIAGCSGELTFRGPFPQIQQSITVELIDAPSGRRVYGVSGLTGSGIANLEAGSQQPTPTPPTPGNKASLALVYNPLTPDNKSIEVKAAYTFNSSAITGGTCIISYSDQTIGTLPQQHQMIFDTNIYKHNRTFQSPPTSVTATVTCSHANYTQEKTTISLSASQPQPTPQTFSVSLTSPKSAQPPGDITFSCSATGSDLKELSLYTNTSGTWKKESTKPLTQPSTQQFQLIVREGNYIWNCEAKTNAGTLTLASQNQSFEVRVGATPTPTPIPSTTPSSCDPTKDCTAWQPDSCPSSQNQARSCNNTDTCGYPSTRSCVYTGASANASTPSPTSTSKPQSKGMDLTTIILIIVIIIAVIGLVLFILKRRASGGEDETLYEEGESGEGQYGGEGSPGSGENEEGQQ